MLLFEPSLKSKRFHQHIGDCGTVDDGWLGFHGILR